MRAAALALGLLTVVALDLVVFIGAAGEPPWFGVLVLALDLSLLASSVALGVVFFRRGRRALGAVFLGNLALMLAALVLRAAGLEFPRAVLFGADLYWLNLYLVGLAVCVRDGPCRATGRPLGTLMGRPARV